jgi:hypothetical protein
MTLSRKPRLPVHIRTKIVTLKDQLDAGQAVRPSHLAESK